MKVAINNRGEVAVRIIRSCQELGLKTILLHSTPDKNTLAFDMADETVELYGQTPLETYLNIPLVVSAIQKSGATLVHPGFGFLSENAHFVKALEDLRNITFIGPNSKTIEIAGNKILAKELAHKAGVPTTPAYTGKTDNPKQLLSEVNRIGYPCIVKAASGGGGKGMKVVAKDKELFEMVESAQREALGAFGSSEVFIEKYIQHPRHIEVQILCDRKGNNLHFYERECSIQRRHQKIFEETPSPGLTPELREKICTAAVKIATAANYTNAGTVEFLLEPGGNFYFMELNTRLQVEHTVTEQTCGVDFVKMQVAVALGQDLGLRQEDIFPRGHALEVRLYAEDPAREFLPSTGKIQALDFPTGPYRRFDFGYGLGHEITPFYDPMIGKVITWAPTREENIQRMRATLSELVIFGVHTNIEFLQAVLENGKFQRGNLSTSFLEEEFKGGFMLPELTREQKAFAQMAAAGGAPSSLGISENSRTKVGSGAASPWKARWPNHD